MTAVVASQPQPEPSMPGTSGKDAGKTVSPKDVHILLVDDERLSRVVVGNLLRKCSYQGMPRCLMMMRSDLPCSAGCLRAFYGMC